MGYGDLQFFDIIVFAAIAIFLVFRLRRVLGKRTGFEKPPHNNQTLKGEEQNENTEAEKYLPDLEENIKELSKAYGCLNNFNHKTFLDGAKAAFETIINAFNNSDKKTLKPLLTEDVFKVFEKSIDEKKTDPNMQIFSLNIESVKKVSIDSGIISVELKFISEQFKNNDESTIIKKEDTWSFQKQIKSKNPNWVLCST